MRRAQIYLEDAEYEALRIAAFKRHESISAILRQFVQEKLLHKSKKRYAAGLRPLIGMVRDTKTDVARRHDDYLWSEA